MNANKLKGKIISKGMNVEGLANEIDIDRSTLYRKFENFEKFTIGEAKAIKKALDMTDLEAIEIFLT